MPVAGTVLLRRGTRWQTRLLPVHAACQRLFGVVIYMYWNERDHPVAHFHAHHAGRRVSVSADGEVLAGGLDPRALQFVREWAVLRCGLSTVGIAATPEPATGPTPRHLAFAVSCVVTTAVWPVLVARRGPAQSWILSACGCATVTVIFAGLSCWLLTAARDGGGDLGMVERLTSAVQGLFPLVVALAWPHFLIFERRWPDHARHRCRAVRREA